MMRHDNPMTSRTLPNTSFDKIDTSLVFIIKSIPTQIMPTIAYAAKIGDPVFYKIRFGRMYLCP